MNKDRNGLEYQDTPYGRAYSRGPVPSTPPLTEDALRELPEGAPITVLWCGGNGPHDYTLGKCDVYLYALTSRGNRGSRLEFIGDHKTDTKVWAS